MEWKAGYLRGTHFAWHLDDNEQEFSACKKTEDCTTPMVDVLSGRWKEKCEELLNENIDNNY
jgi:hypothetical protein